MLDFSKFHKSELSDRFVLAVDEGRNEIMTVPGRKDLVFLFGYEPGQVGELHTHDEFHLVFVRSGQVRFTVGEETRMVGAGDAISILPGTPHGFEVIGEDAPRLVEVVLFPSGAT